MTSVPPRTIALLAGIAGALLVVLSMVLDDHYHASYLYAYVFWSGVSLGSLGIVMVHHLTGGQWGNWLHEPLLAASSPLPLMALLFIPIAFGLHELYVWARPEEVAHDELLQAKLWYLNAPFFFSRTAVYFVIWIGLTYALNKWSSSRQGDAPAARLQRLSAGGLILLVLSASFAAIDWIMTLTPEWYSTIFGLRVAMSQALGALGFVVFCASFWSRHEPAGERPSPDCLNNVGNLMLAFVLVWIYLVFVEFITVWIADVPEEIAWYVPHLRTSWYVLGWIMVVLGFVLPYVLLLFRRLKRNPLALGFVAVLMVCAYWTDAFWLVMPNLRTAGFELTWTDLGAFLGIGGLWLAVLIWRLAASQIHDTEARGAREAMEHG